MKTLQGKLTNIGEKKGTSYVNIANGIFPNVTVKEYEEWDEVMSAVQNLEVTIAMRDEIGVANYLAENPKRSLNLQMIPLEDARYGDPLAIAVHPDSRNLLQWLNLYFEQKGTTGTGENLLSQYEEYYE